MVYITGNQLSSGKIPQQSISTFTKPRPKPLVYTVGSQKLEHGCTTNYAGLTFCLCFEVAGRSCSNFVASTEHLSFYTNTEIYQLKNLHAYIHICTHLHIHTYVYIYICTDVHTRASPPTRASLKRKAKPCSEPCFGRSGEPLYKPGMEGRPVPSTRQSLPQRSSSPGSEGCRVRSLRFKGLGSACIHTGHP